MADIRPFRGTHYNPPVAGDVGRLICPPYDVISPRLQQELYDRSDHNFVRIEFGRELPQESETDNRYTRSAATMAKWLNSGVLRTDEKPAFYVDDHSFTFRGKQYTRRSLTAVIKLEEWEAGAVKPHEVTGSRDKGDRLSLLYALQANTSPIMGLYQDPQGGIGKALREQTQREPIFVADTGGVEHHRVWAVTDTWAIQRIHGLMENQPVYIADGHHRYESALTYRRERRLRVDSEPGSEPFDYVMMTLIEFNDPGLVILPAHRMVRGITQTALDNLTGGLGEFFEVRRVPIDQNDIVGQITGLLPDDEDSVTLVLYGINEGDFQVAMLRDFQKIKPMIPYFHTEQYHKLDVSILDHVVLEELLGLTPDTAPGHVAYSTETLDVLRCIRDGEYQLAVFVNPVKPGVIKAIADAGDRMPRKSTYFHPKIPAGLITHRFRQD